MLPEPEDGLVASIEEVANLLGAAPETLTDMDRQVIYSKILAAQGIAEGALNRPILPELVTVAGVTPEGDPEGARAWGRAGFHDTYRVVSYDGPDPDGSYEVTAWVGIDGREVPLIRGFVANSAAEAIAASPSINLGKRAVSSVSAGGQSVSYATAASAGAAAGVITVAILRSSRWRRRTFRTFATTPMNHVTGNIEIGEPYAR